MAAPSEASKPLTIYLGFDSREAIAADVCAHSILRHTKQIVRIVYLKHRELRKSGMFKRPWLIEGDSGEFRDLLDDKAFSTEFSHTRFLIPELQQFRDWALFLDSDMIFTTDIVDLFKFMNNSFAVMCVKHNHDIRQETSKMDGRVQQKYFRKNWSSFVLWNCDHTANHRLTKEKVTYMPGRELHAFSWLKDNEIGGLPTHYNFISGVSTPLPIINGKQVQQPSVIHYSEGGPWFENCKEVPYADLWDRERRLWEDAGAPDYHNYLHEVEP